LAGPAVYRNSTYRFKLSHPAGYPVRKQGPGKIADLRPRPEASFVVMSAVTTSSAVEPPDLEVRVYGSQGLSLTGWLRAKQLLPSGNGGAGLSKPFRTAHTSGLRVCGSTMIAPPCSYFVAANGWIYQLRPASKLGEAIVRTFTPI